MLATAGSTMKPTEEAYIAPTAPHAGEWLTKLSAALMCSPAASTQLVCSRLIASSASMSRTLSARARHLAEVMQQLQFDKYYPETASAEPEEAAEPS
eukprot:1822-Heterococcus_DN1.PRE.2